MSELLRCKGLHVTTPSGRDLFRGLSLSMGQECVAIVGRNGCGKSTLLEILSGYALPAAGTVTRHPNCELVRQTVDDALELSHGEARRHLLDQSLRQQPRLLLLDEPTQGLDVEGIDWLHRRLDAWFAGRRGGLLAVSHNRELLKRFRQFLIIEPNGCRVFAGSLDELDIDMRQHRVERERSFVRSLNVQRERERHHAVVARRRRRKKNLGRIHEEGRCPSRAQLHGKKSYAQESQARRRKIQEERLDGVRKTTLAARRVLTPRLELSARVPRLESGSGKDVVRLGVVGANGSGKTTLLRTMAGGSARIGFVEQGASNYCDTATLLDRLMPVPEASQFEEVRRALAEHRFPLGLAERPLASLSPGERFRAALVLLFQQQPAIDLLVLDEPTNGLDFLGASALIDCLNAWEGGLVVASHDREFLRAIGVTATRRLDAPGHGQAVSAILVPRQRV